MTRLYFTDPIKALYMMKEFGVKLRNFTQKCLKEFEFEDGEEIYVAKESEHIFKPKDMDYGVVKRQVGFGFCQYSSARGYHGWNYIGGGVCKETVKIINIKYLQGNWS